MRYLLYIFVQFWMTFYLVGCGALGTSVTSQNMLATTNEQPAFRHEKPDAAYVKATLIRRDTYGVPHVFGETDADAAFGFAYAQAEDNFRRIEENFLRASGRGAEFLGEELLLDDWLNRSLKVVILSKREYELAPTKVKLILDGYAAGLNYYLATNVPSMERRLMKVEPWHPLALIRYLYYQRGFVYSSGANHASIRRAFLHLNPTERTPSVAMSLTMRTPLEGSNSWAVTASKSFSGNALLFINPHLPYFGVSQVYEGHVSSGQGWNFSGYSRFGFPLPYVGFNDDLGWASTDNYADLADLYKEQFVDINNLEIYRYGDGFRKSERSNVVIKINTGSEIQSRTFVTLQTHHGPIIAKEEGQLMAVRMAKYEQPGWLDQWYEMTKAEDLESFLKTTSKLDMLFGNYLYADRDGNILYVYNGAVPRRDSKYDWTNPVDGSDTNTEWRGFHPISEIPQILNPPSNYIQNSNGTPFLSVTPGQGGNPDPADFPTYMVTEGDNYRSRASRRILDSQNTFSLNEFSQLAFDTYVSRADANIECLVDAYLRAVKFDNTLAARLAEPIALLDNWDRRSTVTSKAMTLYIHWEEEKFRLDNVARKIEPTCPHGVDSPAAERDLTALELAIKSMTRRWGGWKKTWGDVNRLQRPYGNDEETFDDAKFSLPIDGAPSWAGSINTFWSGYANEHDATRFGLGGHSYVAVVEFGPKVIAYSLHALGASSHAESPNYFDQAELYANHSFKRAWITQPDVEENAVRTYHPGDQPNR